MSSKNNLPITVENILQDVLTDEIFFTLVSSYRNRPITQTIKRGELTVSGLKELANVGFPLMTRNEAEEFIYSVIENEDNFPLEEVCGKVGWHEIDGNRFFMHRRAFYNGKQADVSYTGCLDLSNQGNLADNILFFNERIKDFIGLQAICAISLSSAVVGMITEKDLRFIFHITGASTTGKTTSLMLAGSMWGNPAISPHGIVSNFHTTDNKLVQSMGGNKGILRGLDELSMLNADRTKLTYILTGGNDKQRMTDVDGADNAFRTVIVSTGEISFKTSNYGGIAVRLFEVKDYNFTEDKENADYITEGMFENYGNIGPAFAERLSAYSTEQIKNLLDKYTSKIIGRIQFFAEKKGKCFSPLYGRLAEKIAAVAVAAIIAKKKLGMLFDITKIAVFLICETTMLENGQEQAVEAVEKFMEFYAKNQTKFPKSIKADVVNVWGKTVMNGEKISKIIILYDQFTTVMTSLGYPDINSLIKALKEKEFIKCEEGKNYSRRNISDIKKAKVIVIDVALFEGRKGE